MKRSRLLLAVVVLLAPGCVIQAPHQPVHPYASFDENSLDDTLAGTAEYYRAKAAEAEARGQNGDGWRRVCDRVFQNGMEGFLADQAKKRPNVSDLVIHDEIVAITEDKFLSYKQQCWW